MGRRGRRREHLLGGLEEKRGYWKLIEEALDRTLWRTGSERDRLHRMNESTGPLAI